MKKVLVLIIGLMVLGLASSALAIDDATTMGANVIGLNLQAGYLFVQDNGTIEGLAQLNYGVLEQLDIFGLIGYAKPKHDGYIEYGGGAKYLVLAESGDMPALAVQAYYKGMSISVLGVTVSSYVIPISLIVEKEFNPVEVFGAARYNIPKEGSGTFGIDLGAEYPLSDNGKSDLLGQVSYDFGSNGASGVFSLAAGYNMKF